MLTGCSPILATVDVQNSIQFYAGVLGFTSSWSDGEAASFGAATFGKVTVMFSSQPSLAERISGQQIWIDVEDVDGLHALHLERGAKVISGIEDKPWGLREYTVCDPNGYHLRFNGRPHHTSRGSGVLPAGVSIERRKPTNEEYHEVSRSAFNNHDDRSDVLDRTWSGVVALDTGGKVVGSVRIMYDAPGWFSIWDVGVLQDWQGNRVGTAMMDSALQLIREESAGAFVYLFTYHHGFYERIGFSKDSVSFLKL